MKCSVISICPEFTRCFRVSTTTCRLTWNYRRTAKQYPRWLAECFVAFTECRLFVMRNRQQRSSRMSSEGFRCQYDNNDGTLRGSQQVLGRPTGREAICASRADESPWDRQAVLASLR